MPITLEISNHGRATVELDLQTSPPTVEIRGEKYVIEKAAMTTTSNELIQTIQPDDSRLHGIVCGFSSINSYGAVLVFSFDPLNPPSLLGYDNIRRLLLVYNISPLTAHQIAAITRHNAHAEAQECPICFGTENGRWFFTQCGHGFHRTCISRWYNSGDDRKCPLCRGQI